MLHWCIVVQIKVIVSNFPTTYIVPPSPSACLPVSLALPALLVLACRKETSTGGYLEFIQQQEEEALRAALEKLKQQEAASQP